MLFKQHCFKGEGVLHFVYSANHRKSSKTFGRHCTLIGKKVCSKVVAFDMEAVGKWRSVGLPPENILRATNSGALENAFSRNIM